MTYSSPVVPEHLFVRAQLAELRSQRITTTRDIALFSLTFYSMGRGFDVSFTLGSQVLRLPESAGLVLHFHFGKTFQKSMEAVGVLADAKHPQS